MCLKRAGFAISLLISGIMAQQAYTPEQVDSIIAAYENKDTTEDLSLKEYRKEQDAIWDRTSKQTKATVIALTIIGTTLSIVIPIAVTSI